MEKPASIQEILHLVSQLSVIDKVRLIEQIAPQIEHDLGAVAVIPRKSLHGLCAEDIDAARREAWATFPREDV
jgi:hypothetical protein